MWNPEIRLESRKHIAFLMNEFFPVNFNQIFDDMRSAEGKERIKLLLNCSSREEMITSLTIQTPMTMTRRTFLFPQSET